MPSAQQTVGILLILFGIGYAIYTNLPKKSGVKTTDKKDTSWLTFKPDKKQVEFLEQYVEFIERSAPNANYELWWNYCKLGMSIPEIAQQEASLAVQASSRKKEESSDA